MAETKTALNGVLLVSKPTGYSSHDLVQEVRKITAQRRVGHTGTLDPLATGLMVLCLGRATKASRFVSEFDKTYLATVSLGRTSSTFDAEGIDSGQSTGDISAIRRQDVEDGLSGYVGVIRQRVPIFSAVRVAGQRLYRAARKGLPVDAPERTVEIKSIILVSFEPPLLQIEVTCSSGTYIRSLADDIGRKLGCGAYLAKLERLRVGHLRISEALTVDEIRQSYDSGTLTSRLLGLDQVLDFGAIRVRDEFASDVESGRIPRESDIIGTQGNFSPGDKVFLKSSQGRILAIGTAGFSSPTAVGADSKEKLFKYIRVLN